MSQLSMIRGDTRTVTTVISNLDINGNTVLGVNGVSGWSFWMTAKFDDGDADSLAVFQILPASWFIDIQGNATTPAQVHTVIQPANTSSLPGHQITLSYDVQAKDGSGNIFTVDSGTLTIAPDSTIATS